MVRFLLALCLAAVAVAAASRRRTRGLKAPMSLKSENYFAVLENMVGVQEKELTFLHSKTAAALKHDQRFKAIIDIDSISACSASCKSGWKELVSMWVKKLSDASVPTDPKSASVDKECGFLKPIDPCAEAMEEMLMRAEANSKSASEAVDSGEGGGLNEGGDGDGNGEMAGLDSMGAPGAGGEAEEPPMEASKSGPPQRGSTKPPGKCKIDADCSTG